MSLDSEYRNLLEMESLGKDSHNSKLVTTLHLISSLIVIVCIVSFQIINPIRLALAVSAFLLVLIFSNIPMKIWMKRIAMLLPILSVFALGNLLVSQYYLASSIMIKGLFCVSIVTILMRNNTMDEITSALEALKVPHLFVLQLSLLYRYLFIFSEEFSHMIKSYRMRSRQVRGVSIEDVGPFLGSFILRNIDFGERVYFAMSCRGFNNLRKKGFKEKSEILSGDGSFDIRIKNLSVLYDDKKKAIDDVSLTVKEGERVALIGANGAGKTTLISSILNLVDHQEGTIDIKGVEVNKANASIIRSHIGLIFQNPDHQLFKSKVIDDILFGPTNFAMDEMVVKERLKELIELFDAQNLMDRYIHTLSGGEKRLVALMGILILSPEAILMDEPTVYLDNKERRRLINYLMSNELTQIISTHDLDFALDVCDRVIILNDGRVVADGRAAAILNDKTLLEQYNLELPLKIQGEQ